MVSFKGSPLVPGPFGMMRSLQRSGTEAAVMRHVVLAAILFGVSPAFPAAQDSEPPPTDPRAFYIFPLGGRQGETVEVRIDGQALAGTYAVWADCPALEASVEQVLEVDRQIWEGHYLPEKRLTHQITVQVTISRGATPGGHTLRLVSPRGVSDPMPFRVSSPLEPVILEDESRTGADKPVRGQAVKYPVAINGRIARAEGGEVDYYSFDADAGRELHFDVFFPRLVAVDDLAGGEMFLYLYEPSPSWVDPHRLVELAFSDDPISLQGGLITGDDSGLRARLTHRFGRSGRYLIAVKGFDDRGGPGFVYQLRIARSPLEETTTDRKAWPLAHPPLHQWEERTFHRPLPADRLQQLSERTVHVPPEQPEPHGEAGLAAPRGAVAVIPSKRSELKSPFESASTYRLARDADGSQVGVPMVELPAILEGAIDRPGKTDFFRFRAGAGQGLAFEVETPDARIPRFNPWVRILDHNRQVVFSCIYNRVEGNNVMLFRYFEPKMVYTFERDGEYILEVRDLTNRYGGRDFAYRVMIRSQVPHIGGLELDVDQVNLAQGKAEKLTVTADREEGFAGEVALSVENLPAGVRVYPTAVHESYRPPAFDEGEKDIFRAETQKMAVTLIAEENAAPTRLPVFVVVKARPVVNGVPGAEIAVGEIPLMVVAAEESEAAGGTE